jgi:hypothetical protein
VSISARLSAQALFLRIEDAKARARSNCSFRFCCALWASHAEPRRGLPRFLAIAGRERLQVRSASRPTLSWHTQRQTTLEILIRVQRKGGERPSEERSQSRSIPALPGLIRKHITRHQSHLSSHILFQSECAGGVNGRAREESLRRMASAMAVHHRKC